MNLPPASRTTSDQTRQRVLSRPVTSALVAACVLVWLAEEFIPGVYQSVALTPRLGATEPWRFLTSAFAHSTGFTHILMNMFSLIIIGPHIEYWMGKANYLAVYLLSALGGGVAFVLLSGTALGGGIGPNTGVVGASGAVFGLFGATLALNQFLGRPTQSVWILLAVNMVYGFMVPGIAWQAHLGGFLAGLASAWSVAVGARRRARGEWDPTWLGFGIVLLVLIASLVVQYRFV